MKILSVLTASCGLGLAIAATLYASPRAEAGDRDNTRTIAVYERAVNETNLDLGAAGDSQGDTIAFDNPVFDPVTHHSLGRSRGQCTRTAVGAAYECTWTTSLPKGSVMVSGPFYDAADSTLAIIGGTGEYRNARGEMLLRARPLNNATAEYDFIFRISND